jgi:hypothetical protein
MLLPHLKMSRRLPACEGTRCGCGGRLVIVLEPTTTGEMMVSDTGW